jgi:uncharacterized protein (DUF433 family)
MRRGHALGKLSCAPAVLAWRLTLGTIVETIRKLGGGLSESEILSDYPELTGDDIKAAFQFAYRLKDKVT